MSYVVYAVEWGIGTNDEIKWKVDLIQGISNLPASTSLWQNNANYLYINSTLPPAINVTKICLSSNSSCDNYQLMERNATGVYLTWY